jgi:SAM-dependent methyltransferase
MPIDNDVYNRHATGWWDENEPLNLLHGSVTPARFGYFVAVLQRLGLDPSGLRALDIGCGGGFLAEEFARLGCRVLGIDPSALSLETARRHAASCGLEIDYRVGFGEHDSEIPDDQRVNLLTLVTGAIGDRLPGHREVLGAVLRVLAGHHLIEPVGMGQTYEAWGGPDRWAITDFGRALLARLDEV